MTRMILLSGKGGVGKTTVAAATAVALATCGHRTLAVSLDRAHNLGDVFGVKLGPEPAGVPGVPRLHALEADPQAELGRHWRTLSQYFAGFLEWAGVAGAEADEIAVFPGLEEILILARLTEIVEASDHDVVVVDLAPTASSLRLLSFPELMSGAFGRLLKWERSFMRLARPAARRLLSVPLPEEAVYDAMTEIAGRLARLRELLLDPAKTIVRLVAIPERIVVEETRSAFTLLSLFGLTVDMVVMNRVLPAALASTYLGAWTGIQARELARAEEQFGAVELSRLTFQPDEVIGARALGAVAREIYGDRDPAEARVSSPAMRVTRRGRDSLLEIRLPHTEGRALDLKQRGDELIVTLDGWRRQIAVPRSLRGKRVATATLAEGSLVVHFQSKGDVSS